LLVHRIISIAAKINKKEPFRIGNSSFGSQ
jgi:hypothetical protein